VPVKLNESNGNKNNRTPFALPSRRRPLATFEKKTVPPLVDPTTSPSINAFRGRRQSFYRFYDLRGIALVNIRFHVASSRETVSVFFDSDRRMPVKT